MSHSDTPAGVSVPLGPAQQCQCGTWTLVLYGSDTHEDSAAGGREAETAAIQPIPQRLPYATPGFRAGIAAKHHEKQQVFWAFRRTKGSRHESRCAHTKPQLENTAVNCKTQSQAQSDAASLPSSPLPLDPISATQSTSVPKTDNYLLFSSLWVIFPCLSMLIS